MAVHKNNNNNNNNNNDNKYKNENKNKNKNKNKNRNKNNYTPFYTISFLLQRKYIFFICKIFFKVSLEVTSLCRCS